MHPPVIFHPPTTDSPSYFGNSLTPPPSVKPNLKSSSPPPQVSIWGGGSLHYVKFKCTITIISTIGNSAITNGNYALLFIAPSYQAEADTRTLLYAKGASQSGMKTVLICTIDTNVVAVSIRVFEQLDLLELWNKKATGYWNKKAFKISRNTHDHSSFWSKCLPLFHAFTGCGQVSFFAGRGKKCMEYMESLR